MIEKHNKSKLLKKIGALADSAGYSAFLVGGSVRDLLLGMRNMDLDIVVEGDAIELGKALSKELDGSLVVHRRFGTCTVVTKDKSKIDLATARKEVYEKPAALPTVVEFGSLKNDLMRRDFTINAMAVSLSEEGFGQLIDFFGGESDLKDGRIRVIHDGSFIDDPTRIFRAVRFEQRFGFVIDKHTEGLIRNAVEDRMFDRVNPQRIRDEIILMLKEDKPIRALKRMSELHEFRFIHPKIRLDDKLVKFYNAIGGSFRWYEGAKFKKEPIEKWLIYLMMLLEPLDYGEAVSVCDKFVFKRGERMKILSYKKCAKSVMREAAVKKNIPPSRVYKLLSPLSYEALLLIMARSASGPARNRIRDFFEKHNGLRISIKGGDIKALGLKPGPQFKKILEKTLYKKIDGALKTHKDELEYAKKLIKRGI